MVTHRRFAPHEWRLYRELRLRALRDAPDAFGSTFAREDGFPDTEWIARMSAGAASSWNFPMLVEEGDRAIGLAWVRIEPEDPTNATLFQVWVDPDFRRRGAGATLLTAAIEWARTAGAQHLLLSVALGHGSALAFYKTAGFSEVGGPTVLRPDSQVLQQAMRFDL
ncbi:MAG: GNAT family N-acetyltransferase [bacterium]